MIRPSLSSERTQSFRLLLLLSLAFWTGPEHQQIRARAGWSFHRSWSSGHLVSCSPFGISESPLLCVLSPCRNYQVLLIIIYQASSSFKTLPFLLFALLSAFESYNRV